jgi:RND family efflux transporter MFP subunit
VAEGQRVGKGQILARIKSESLANASNIAQATLKEARDAYNRLKKLRDANALPEIKWVEVQSKLEQAENAAAIAAREVSDAAIYAPAAGIVSKKFAEVGQNVAPGIPVFSIVSVDDIKVSIPVPGDEIGGIAEGDKAKVSFDALGGASVDGVVTQKGVVADPLTRAYDVKIAISGQDGKVLPGMTCGVVLKKAGDVAGVTLPSQAVQLGSDNRNFVWLVRGGKAERRFVTSGGMVAGGIYVTDGISAGDSVIVAGMHKVSSGTPVSAVIENK